MRCCSSRATPRCAFSASTARGRSSPFRICSIRSRRRPTTATCSRTWRVYQTRAFFLRRYGYLTDNPAIGPLLAEHYWQPGNSVDHNATLLKLTGEGFSARPLADACNRSIEQAWSEAQSTMQAAGAREYPNDYPANLDATVRVVHGVELLADNRDSEEVMCADFERWVGEHYPAGS